MGVSLELELDGVRKEHSPGWNKQIARQLSTITDTGQYPEKFDPWRDEIPPAAVYYARHVAALEGFAASCRSEGYEHGAEFFEKIIGEIRARGECRMWQQW